jgi:hypothetical protein
MRDIVRRATERGEFRPAPSRRGKWKAAVRWATSNFLLGDPSPGMGMSIPRPSCGPRPQQAWDGRSVGGRRACYQLTPAVHLDLVEDHRQVILHRVRRDEQPWR